MILWTLWPMSDTHTSMQGNFYVYDSSHKNESSASDYKLYTVYTASTLVLKRRALFLSVHLLECLVALNRLLLALLSFLPCRLPVLGTYLGFPAPFTPSGVPKAEEKSARNSPRFGDVCTKFWQQTPILRYFCTDFASWEGAEGAGFSGGRQWRTRWSPEKWEKER